MLLIKALPLNTYTLIFSSFYFRIWFLMYFFPFPLNMLQKITDPVTSSPNSDSVTSRPDDEWLLESSLVSEAECAWDTMASFLPSSLPNCPCLLSQCFSSELLHSGTRGRSQDPEKEHSTQLVSCRLIWRYKCRFVWVKILNSESRDEAFHLTHLVMVKRAVWFTP